MRTITFEVEVDDKIFDTMVPSIDDDAVKNAPDGRLFLCVDKTSERKKLVRLHCDVTAEGDKEALWFDYCCLPDEMRVVKDSKGIVANGKSAAELVAESDAELQEDMDDKRASRIEAILADILQRQFENQQELLKKHEDLLDHFKQIHEQENWLQEHQNRAEDRLMNHIQECCDKATLTTKSYGHDILHALPELEDRIKKCVGHAGATPSPTPVLPLTTDDRELMLNVILQQQRTVDYYRMCVKGLQDKLNSKLNPED